MNLARTYAIEQASAGASLLDVNMGLSGINELEMMKEAIKMLSPLSSCPLCLDSTSPEVMEAALRLYPGRALLNSVSAEKDRIEKMLPLVKKYGAVFVLLPVTDSTVPEELEERKEVTLSVLSEAEKLGLDVEDCIIDGLVMTVSSSPNAPQVTADFVNWCSSTLKANTTGGISNVSFGMPERAVLNSGFLNLLIGKGLTTAIINPSSKTMMNIKFSTDALLGRDTKLHAYLDKYTGIIKDTEQKTAINLSPLKKCYNSVIYGEEENMAEIISEAISAGEKPSDIVDNALYTCNCRGW